MRDWLKEARIGVLLYDGIEPIDLGGTVGVVSMARRVLPNLKDIVVARKAGAVRMAGGLSVDAPYGVDDCPAFDVLVVCGGPGWPEASQDPRILEFIRKQRPENLASVCTGAMILAASGVLKGRVATTRRRSVGSEVRSPLDLLGSAGVSAAVAAAVVDDVVVTGGGVSLCIDTTLHLIGRLYGAEARDEVAGIIEYDRALRANQDALGYFHTDGMTSDAEAAASA